MATYVQRAQSIGDALVNGVATQAQLVRLADAFARQLEIDPATLTNGQKAELLVRRMREHALSVIRRAEGDQAEEAARTDTAASVAAGFAESP